MKGDRKLSHLCPLVRGGFCTRHKREQKRQHPFPLSLLSSSRSTYEQHTRPHPSQWTRDQTCVHCPRVVDAPAGPCEGRGGDLPWLNSNPGSLFASQLPWAGSTPVAALPTGVAPMTASTSGAFQKPFKVLTLRPGISCRPTATVTATSSAAFS